MRIASLFLLIFTVITVEAQVRTPRQIYLNYQELELIYHDQDSLRTAYGHIEDFQMQRDEDLDESYKTMQELIDDTYFDLEELTPTANFTLIDEIKPGSKIFFEDEKYMLKIIDESHYQLYQRDSTDGGYWADGLSLERYRKYNLGDFDMILLFNYHESTDYLFKNKDQSFSAILADMDSLSVGSLSTLDEPYINNHRYQGVEGYKRFQKDGKTGVKDGITGEIILPAIYDCVALDRWITTCLDGKFGAFDYRGQEVLPLAYKDYLYTRFRNNMLFLDFENRLYQMGFDHEIELLEDPSKGPRGVNNTFTLRQNRHIILNFFEDGFELATPIEADDKNVTFYRGDIQSASNYENFFFDSRNKTDYIANPEIIFGLRPDGKLDLFSIHGGMASFMYKDVDDFKLVRNFIPMSELYDYEADVIVQKGGLYKLYEYNRKDHYFYKDVFYAYDEFFRVQFKDGTLGWATRDGREFPDPKN